MNMIGLFIENYKIIKGAQLDFDGKRLVQIRGGNGQGKSSVIEAIERLFKGGSAPGVVTTGEKKSTIIGKFGDYTATKTIDSEGKAILKVEKENFGNLQAAQTFMDTLAGEFIDPVWFAELPGKDAMANLIKYSGIDFVPIDAKIAQKEETRRDFGRDIKKVGEPVPCAKVEAVSISDLLAQRKEIVDYNKEQDEKANQIIKANETLHTDLTKMLTNAKGQTLFVIGETLLKIQKYYFDQAEKIKKLPMPEPIKDTTIIDNKISNAEEINSKAIAYNEYIQKKNQRDSLQEAYNNLTKEITVLRQERSDMLKKAILPLPGLEIGDDTITLKGVGYDTLSTSERLKIAITLAVQYSGELKTVYIKRGECLDAKSIEKLKEYAEAMDFQIIMEIVDDSYSVQGDGIFYIQEGKIKGESNG